VAAKESNNLGGLGNSIPFEPPDVRKPSQGREHLPAAVTVIQPGPAKTVPERSCGTILFGTLIAFAFAASPASAQTQPGCTSAFGGLPFYNNFTQVIGGVVGATTAITSVIGTMNTAFQAQGDAFAVGLPNAQTDQIAGGTWGRLIGGRVDNEATGMFSGTIGPGRIPLNRSSPFPILAPEPGATGVANCNANVRQDYAGFQLGQDLARLNLSGSGATLHAGITGGYAESRDQDQAGSGFSGDFQVPFAGLYATYTSGNFFIDGLLRSDFYQMDLSAASAALGNQKADAFGLSETISAGYKIDLSNNWFVTPSISGIHSTTKVDTLDLPGGFGFTSNALNLPPGSVQFSNIESLLGRFGVQVGTSFTSGNVVWQPFAAANVWHEFAGDVKATYSAPEYYDGPATLHSTFPCSAFTVGLGLYPNGCGNAVSGTLAASRVGTYGQYSLGVSGQMTGSPWLGYMRLDYRDGASIQALGFNGGVRYQFDATQRIANGTLFDGPPRATPYDWSGPYIGAFTGAAQGKDGWNFPQAANSANPQIAGLIVGGTLGYNKQFDRWVVGVEGEVAYTNASGGQACLGNVFNANPSQNCNNDIHLVATAAARFGYTWLDRILLFAKAGGAWTNSTLTVSCNGDAQFFQGGCFPANNPFGAGVQTMTLNDPRFGGLMGAGFELALTPMWSAKLEYDFMDFGSKSFVLPDTTQVSVKEYLNELKFGLNYHFNGYDPEAGGLGAPTMALKMPVKAPPPDSRSWTGAYAGADVGYRMADAQWNTTGIPTTEFINVFFGVGATVPDPSTNPADFFSAALQGGLFGGYDWQVARQWVTGVEGDIAFGNSSMSRGGIPGTYGNGAGPAFFIMPGVEAQQADSATVKFGSDGSVRARLGYLSTPNVLIYGTGGVAFQQVSVTAACSGTAASFCGSVGRYLIVGYTEPPTSETLSTTRTGWTVGGGVEAALSGNWFGKAEFRYADFGHLSHSFFAGTVDDEVDISLHPQTYTVLGGVGYKFAATAIR
jgi:opacity protein-like surface antigen